MIAVDTNILIRYLFAPLDNHNPQWQVAKAVSLIDRANTVFISDIVLAELEWALESVFHVTRKEIVQVFRSLASNCRFCFEDWQALQSALIDYQEYKQVDLSDCLIARRAHNKGATTLYTFENEKKLGALPIVTSVKLHR